MKGKMAKVLATVALMVTGLAYTGCMFCFSDEPHAIESMID